MVKVLNDSPLCCCPPKYNRITRKGSLFCPTKAFTDDGPFADSHVQEKLELDEARKLYPLCPKQDEDKDAIVCSMEFGEYGGIDSEVLEALSGSARLTHVTNCEYSKSSENGVLSSVHLQGNYPFMCPLGDTFASCAGASNNGQCSGNDLPFSFRGRIGKVVRVPKNEQDAYEVSFNDGRTVYDFPQHHLQIQIPPSNYELWFVQRNRFEKILQKRKGFKVFWPLCTFDLVNDRYFPFAQLSIDGKVLDSI